MSRKLVRFLDTGAAVARGEPLRAAVAGPVGCGKSTLLRMIAQDALEAAASPVVALQLMRDNSAGYAGAGAREFFDTETFRAEVQAALTAGLCPLVIIDGLATPESSQALLGWLRKLPDVERLSVLCGSINAELADSFMAGLSGADGFVRVRIDARRERGLFVGTYQRPGESAQLWTIELPAFRSYDESQFDPPEYCSPGMRTDAYFQSAAPAITAGGFLNRTLRRKKRRKGGEG